MKLRISLLAVATLYLGCAGAASAQTAAPSAPNRIAVTIDAQQTAAPVSKYEFGMFIEHLRTLIYRSLWSEIIDDRKFYFPISSSEPEVTAQPQGGNPFRGMQLRKWRPIGPDEVIVMDKDRPFVGDQSPRIQLAPDTPHGVIQAGLALVKGKRYNGRIYLRGTPGTKVQVALIWGEGKNDRQTISFAALTNE
jgi:alpha-N-arabinofuranosidase